MSWFVQVGEERFDFVSFNDDSSPDLRTGEKISIHAQVMPGKNLTWFYDTVPLFPDIGGELKSRRVIDTFNAMPSGQRAAYWRNGLSDVRIHIVDPTLPKQRIAGILRSILQRDDALPWLEREARNGNTLAKSMLRLVREQLAEYILLFNSSAGQLHHLIELQKRDSYTPLGNSRPRTDDEPLQYPCGISIVTRRA